MHANEIERRERVGEDASDVVSTTHLDLANSADYFLPSEDFFEALALPRVDFAAVVARRPLVNCAAPLGGILCDVRRDAARAQFLNKVRRVISLIGPKRDAAGPTKAVDHLQGSFAFGRAGCGGQQAIHDQTVPILHQGMSKPKYAPVFLLLR